MNHLYDKVMRLRLKGYSYNELNRLYGVPKSTLSGWLSRVILPSAAVERLQSRVHQGVVNGLIKRNKMQTVIAQDRAKKIREYAREEMTDLSRRDLQLFGIILYWAEGYKRAKNRLGREIVSHSISLTNSDDCAIRYFVYFLKKIMNVPDEKIKIHVRIFPHTDIDKTVDHWVAVTGLSKSNFYKSSLTVSLSSKNKRPFNRLPFGTAQVLVADTKAFYRLMGWIDGIKDKLALMEKNV